MGIGGGGYPDLGLKSLFDALDEGLAIGWIDVDDLADETWTASVYETGTIAPLAPKTQAEIERMDLKPVLEGKEMVTVLQELADYNGVTLGAVVSVELGPDSTTFPLVAAARVGLPFLDGDYAGRAVPEEMQGTPFLFEKDIYPFVCVDKWGTVSILKNAANFHTVERVQKMLSVAAFGSGHLASTLLTGKETKDIVIRDTLTYCLNLGSAVREANEKGRDPVQAIVDFTKGWLLFTGEIERKDWEDRDGYMWGTTYIKGMNKSKGHTFRCWFKNENQIGWLGNKPIITCPDLPAIVDLETGEGKINTYLEEGERVAVIGMKGPEIFRSERGLSGAGPKYFGFDIDYIPIEERMAATKLP
jgi:DUF917 family protein